MTSLATVAGSEYQDLLEDLKSRVRITRVRAAMGVNRELVLLYREIGREISGRMTEHGWGAKVVDQLARDLRRSFPDMKGFSPRNLRYMRSFAEAWPEPEFLQQAVAKIPWGHHVRILDKAGTPEERVFYVTQTLEHGWARNVLVDLSADVRERELERSLVGHIRSFLLELGVGFAFVGHQVHLEVDGRDFYLDMLFYHLRLRCYVVVELKTEEFEPEHTGKMNFYLSAVDDLLRHPEDRATIGLLLCKSRSRVMVEYALRDTTKPIGVASW